MPTDRKPFIIDNGVIEAALGLELDRPVTFDHLGLVNSLQPNVLTFLDTDRFLSQLRNRNNFSGVFTTPALAKKLDAAELIRILSDDPRYCFYTLYNYCAKQTYKTRPSVIHPTASIHPRAYVSESNVEIGANSVIEPNATVLADVVLGTNCRVGAGAVVGCDDAEVQQTSRGLIKVCHDGRLRIGDRVEIGAGSVIDKGFSFQDTVIGDDTKLANRTYIGHSAQIGKGCLLLGCGILGSTKVEDGVRINPGAMVRDAVTVGEGALISMGAIVVQSVPRGTHVSGNFAIEHRRFLHNYTKVFGPF